MRGGRFGGRTCFSHTRQVVTLGTRQFPIQAAFTAATALFLFGGTFAFTAGAARKVTGGSCCSEQYIVGTGGALHLAAR